MNGCYDLSYLPTETHAASKQMHASHSSGRTAGVPALLLSSALFVYVLLVLVLFGVRFWKWLVPCVLFQFRYKYLMFELQEGDMVDEFGKLCKVQSDKASVEITSRYSGRIQRLHHSSGDMVKARTLLLFSYFMTTQYWDLLSSNVSAGNFRKMCATNSELNKFW